jgi:hypothetical protein
MTPEEAKAIELQELERDLKKAGVIRLSLPDEIKRIEKELAASEAQESIDPRLEAKEKDEKRFKLMALKLLDDVAILRKQPSFRRFIWKWLEGLGLYQVSYRKMDSHETALREGRRSAALDMLAILHMADPGLFVQMQSEHISDIKSREANNG